MSNRLAQKSIVIVGGTTGLGLSAAQACVDEGASVVVVGRNENSAAEADEQLGDSGTTLVADAVESGTAERAIALAIESFGKFDALYHVAGGSGRRFGDGPLDQISDEGWQYTMDLNMKSLFLSNRAAVRQFLQDGRGGAVLNMGSVLWNSPASEHFATHTYATTKAAVVGLTTAAAAYYAKNNIRFNVVAPALVETPLAQRAAGDPEIMRYVATKQPLDGGRIGQPADVDSAVVYLLSDESRFVTGQVLAVDGGWSVTEGQIGVSDA
jgi:NAD(P)-dependent dehydrogenase (short-subunit alcohol dehydrogenase family)